MLNVPIKIQLFCETGPGQVQEKESLQSTSTTSNTSQLSESEGMAAMYSYSISILQHVCSVKYMTTIQIRIDEDGGDDDDNVDDEEKDENDDDEDGDDDKDDHSQKQVYDYDNDEKDDVCANFQKMIRTNMLI